MGQQPSDADVPFVTISEIVSLSRPYLGANPDFANLYLIEGWSN